MKLRGSMIKEYKLLKVMSKAIKNVLWGVGVLVKCSLPTLDTYIYDICKNS